MEEKESNYTDLIILARILDNQFQGPFGIKFGLDAIIGLIPGVGDFLTSGLSSYILLRAALLKLPTPILIQMAFNILIDQLIGIFPLIGDLFDVYWQSNQRNVNLIKEYAQNQNTVPTKVWLNITLVTFFIAIVLMIPIIILYQLLLFIS